MTVRAYFSGLEALSAGGLVWLSGDVRALLVSSAYSFDAAHSTLVNVAGGARVAFSPTPLTGRTRVRSGALVVHDADDLPFGTVVAAAPSAGVILYLYNASEALTTLLLFADGAGSGFPVNSDGGTVTIAWNNGANKIFSLGNAG